MINVKRDYWSSTAILSSASLERILPIYWQQGRKTITFQNRMEIGVWLQAMVGVWLTLTLRRHRAQTAEPQTIDAVQLINGDLSFHT